MVPATDLTGGRCHGACMEVTVDTGLFAAERSEAGVEYEVRRGGGGSWMVRVGFLCFLPIAEATKELNLEPVECSLDLAELREDTVLASWARLEPEACRWRAGTSLGAFDLDHQDLLGEAAGKVDMTEIGEGASWRKES